MCDLEGRLWSFTARLCRATQIEWSNDVSQALDNPRTATELLDRMFDAEMRLLRTENADPSVLVNVFHEDVVIHEPASLPYGGEWRGLNGVAALFKRMREVWSNMDVQDLEAVRHEDTVFMRCKFRLTARASGVTLEQPFAEVLRFSKDRLIDGTPFYYDTAAIVAALSQKA